MDAAFLMTVKEASDGEPGMVAVAVAVGAVFLVLVAMGARIDWQRRKRASRAGLADTDYRSEAEAAMWV